jgi:hypothetical protein
LVLSKPIPFNLEINGAGNTVINNLSAESLSVTLAGTGRSISGDGCITGDQPGWRWQLPGWRPANPSDHH